MEKWPSTFNRLKLRGIWGKWKEEYLLGYLQWFERMKSCLVNKKDNDRSTIFSWESCFVYESSCFCKLSTSNIHQVIGDTGKDKEFTLAGSRMNEAIYIVPLISGTMMSEWTVSCSLSCPYPSNNRLESYTSFIFCPDFYFFPWIFLSSLFGKILEFFLKASCSSHVALFSWASLGTWREKPRYWRYLHPVTALVSFPVISPRYLATFGHVQSPSSEERLDVIFSRTISWSSLGRNLGRVLCFLISSRPEIPCLLYRRIVSWAQVSFIPTRFIAVWRDTARVASFLRSLRTIERKWSRVLSVGFFAFLYRSNSSCLVWWRASSIVWVIAENE